MPVWSQSTPIQRRIRNARSQACVRPAAILMCHPLAQRAPKMALIERDHEIQTLATDCPDQAFAMGIRLRRPNWRSQNPQAHRPQRLVDAFGIDAVAIMDDKS